MLSFETEWQIGNPRLQQNSKRFIFLREVWGPDIIHEPKLRTPGNFLIGRTTAAADHL